MILLVNMGEKLKTLRTEMGLIQTQVANRVGVVVSAVSAYESGMRYPSYKVLIKLAALYHVSQISFWVFQTHAALMFRDYPRKI